MKSEERRNLIINLLKESNGSISASFLANKFNVTRQIIVADIALLRASGYSIVADNKGYKLNNTNSDFIRRIAVQHSKSDVNNEFYAIIDNGGKIIDVIVDHPVYGKISAELNISSRYEADEFVIKLNETNSNPLSLLTQGIHVHTIEIPNEESFERIKTKLTELGILITE